MIDSRGYGDGCSGVLMRLRLKGALRLMRVENLELRPVLLGSPSTVVTRQFIRLPVTISILVTTGSAGGISADKSGLELGPCFDSDAWRGFKLWQLQSVAGLYVIQF